MSEEQFAEVVSQYVPPAVEAEAGVNEKKEKKSVSQNKLVKRLRREVGRALHDYNMIQDGDRIMVCLSGGKDSYTMLDILMQLQQSAPVKFELVAVNLDQMQPGFPKEILPNYLESLGVEYQIITEDTYSAVTRVIPEGKTMCSLCSRLRRGILYKAATALGCNKLALGHHRDDIIETMFLNMFHGGKIKAMPAKLKSDDGKHILIRPLAYCREQDIERYSEMKEFPIIPCNLCGSQENLQRVHVKRMLQDWDKQFPGRVDSLFTATQNIVPSQMLDRNLFDFEGLEETQVRDDAHEKRIPVVNQWFGLSGDKE